MKKIFLRISATLLVTLGISSALIVAPVGAVDPFEKVCTPGSTDVICANKDENAGNVVGPVVNTLLFIVGILSAVMIIVGGLRYTLSRGDAANVTAAKNTIMYAVVGLIVSSIAFVVVNWVLNIF